MPDFAEQDHRRLVRAPAQRARLVPAPIAAPANVLVVTGPSGVGKGTLIRALRERRPGLELSVSATTRSPRPGEEDGRDYYFLGEEEFDRRLGAGDFLEHATYAGNRYGTLRSEIERATEASSGKPGVGGLLLEIELQGARQVRKALPEAVQVFIAPPSEEALRARLVGRGSDTPEQIEDRLNTAREELDAAAEFEYVIVNDRLETAVEGLVQLVDTIWGDQRSATAGQEDGEAS